jgi:hypothetical protein
MPHNVQNLYSWPILTKKRLLPGILGRHILW